MIILGGGILIILGIVDYWIERKISTYILEFLKNLNEWIASFSNYLLCLLIISAIVNIVLLIKWWRLYSICERFENKFGVLWDKKKRMYCTNCRKLLKNSTKDFSTFFCSDPKCNNKHFLRDETGNPITKNQAIEKMKK